MYQAAFSDARNVSAPRALRSLFVFFFTFSFAVVFIPVCGLGSLGFFLGFGLEQAVRVFLVFVTLPSVLSRKAARQIAILPSWLALVGVKAGSR